MNLKLLVLGVARRIGLLSVCRSLTRYRLRIICYHGGCIGDESHFNPKLFATPELLDSRLRWLRAKGFTPLSLSEAVEKLRSRAPLPPLPVVVTLDDGWYSSVRDLVPVIGGHGFPSTLYLATRAFESGSPVLDVVINYTLWRVGPRLVNIVGLSPELDGTHDLSLVDVRVQLSSAVLGWIESNADTAAKCQEMLEDFGRFVGVPASVLALESRRFSYMSLGEAQTLQKMGCSVELHGHRHWYPLGQPAKLRDDIEQCRRSILAAELGEPRHYCYPSGEFDSHASTVLAAMGVRSATTCSPGLVPADAAGTMYQLPRFLDGESVTELEFEAEMSGFTGVLRSMARRRFAAP